VTAAVLLGAKYSGLLAMPVQAIVEALKELVTKARTAHKRSIRTAEDVLNTYTREFYGKFVVIRRDEEGRLLAELGRDAMGKTSTRNTVMGRIEHVTPHHVDYFIEEQLLKNHCASMSFGYADFKRQLEKMTPDGYEVRFGAKKDLLSRTDGPSLRVNVMHLRIPKDKFDDAAGSIPMVKD
jgi:hypothetical protein